jgi:hypothetical protein
MLLNTKNSRWYYPSTKGELEPSFHTIIKLAQEYDGDILKDRYGLQYVKALFAIKNWQQIVDYWENTGKYLPNGMIKDWIFEYVCGAWFRCGQQERAMTGYGKRGDIGSLYYCASRMNPDFRSSDYVRVIAEYSPDSDKIAEYLHEVCTSLERYDCSLDLKNEDKVEFISRFEKNCLYGAKRSKGVNKAVWYYTAAFVANFDGRPQDAYKVLKLADNVHATEYMRESLRVLRMIVESQVLPYNAKYEKKLRKDIKWLDNKIISNLNPETVSITNLETYRIKYSLSYYYWNDMMRKLLAGYVAPRMIKEGKPERALELLNYADNRMISVVGKVNNMNLDEYRRSSKHRNYIDYSNDFFITLDTLDLAAVVSYAKSLDRNNGAFSKWLNARGYTDRNYINDIIGTRYLRLLDYKSAERYLSLVSEEYENSLNTSGYMMRNPFEYKMRFGTKPQRYKLDFAQKMLKCERDMKSSDPNLRGRAMVDYGFGLQQSFTYCWALTQYSRSIYGTTYYDEEWEKEVLSKAEKYRIDGSAIIQNPELAAEVYFRLGAYITIARRYPNTEIGMLMRRKCDRWCDYIK